MSKLTKGPWAIIGRTTSYIDIGGNRQENVEVIGLREPAEFGYESVCRVYVHAPGEANAALIARAPELQQRVDELQIECDGWRQEGVALRQMVRDYEPDKERMDAYRRDLEEIGKTIGCDHIDDGLQRCVESTLDDLESDNQRLRELLRRVVEAASSDDWGSIGVELLEQIKHAIGRTGE